MSIRTQCPNGHQLAAKDELAGRRIKCPKCKAITTIPAPVEEIIDLSEDALIEETPEGPATGSESDDETVSGGLIAACVASVASLVLGLVFLVVLLLSA